MDVLIRIDRHTGRVLEQRELIGVDDGTGEGARVGMEEAFFVLTGRRWTQLAELFWYKKLEEAKMKRGIMPEVEE